MRLKHKSVWENGYNYINHISTKFYEIRMLSEIMLLKDFSSPEKAQVTMNIYALYSLNQTCKFITHD